MRKEDAPVIPAPQPGPSRREVISTVSAAGVALAAGMQETVRDALAHSSSQGPLAASDGD